MHHFGESTQTRDAATVSGCPACRTKEVRVMRSRFAHLMGARLMRVKTRTLISGLALLAVVIGARPEVSAAGESGTKKPPAEQTYTITQLDAGATSPAPRN